MVQLFYFIFQQIFLLLKGYHDHNVGPRKQKPTKWCECVIILANRDVVLCNETVDKYYWSDVMHTIASLYHCIHFHLSLPICLFIQLQAKATSRYVNSMMEKKLKSMVIEVLQPAGFTPGEKSYPHTPTSSIIWLQAKTYKDTKKYEH